MTTSHDRHVSAMLPLSVVIPAFQRAGHVERTVRSAQAQMPRPPAQVIVVDDGSTDGTAELAQAAGATVLRQASNEGAAAARNRGMLAADHPWVALLDSDDEWLPHHLDLLWGARGDHVLVSDSALMSRTRAVYGNPGRHPRVLDSPAQALWPTNPSPPSCSLLRRADALAVGGFRDMPLCEDLEFLTRLLERGSGLSLPNIGCLYAQHPGQMSSGRSRDMRAVIDALLTDTCDRPWNTSRLRRQLAAAHRWDNAVADTPRRGARVLVAGLSSLRRPADVAAVATLVGWRLRSRLRGRRR